MKDIIPLDYCQETINLKKTIESGFIVLGERLTKIKDEEMWKSQWSSFAEYLMEMNINESTASKMIAVHKTYVERFGVEESLLIEAGWDKLYSARELAEVATSTEEATDVVKHITTLRRDDTRQLLREKKNPNCHHEDSYEIHLRCCRTCGNRQQING